jgi:hypothetical protein
MQVVAHGEVEELVAMELVWRHDVRDEVERQLQPDQADRQTQRQRRPGRDGLRLDALKGGLGRGRA